MDLPAKKNPGLMLRPFYESDFDAFEEIVRELWYSDDEERVGRACARQELAYHLEHALAGVVAVNGETNEPLGLALVHGEDTGSAWAALASAERASLSDDRDCMDAINETLGLLASEAELLEACASHDATGSQVGEVQLLIVGAGARGMRVGTTLLNEAAAILAARGCVRFRLATDEGCDWGYYEHIGMARVAEGTSDALVGADGGPFRIYVYEGGLPFRR